MTIYTDDPSPGVRQNICDYPISVYGIIKNSAALGWHNSYFVSNIRFSNWDSLKEESHKKLDKKSVDDVFSLYGINYVNVPNDGINQSLFNHIITDRINTIAIEKELCSVKPGGNDWYLMQSVKFISNPITLLAVFIVVILLCFFIKRKIF